MRNKILQLLSEDAQLTPEQISVMLNTNKEIVQSEIKKCEQEGIIKGYRAVINWDKVENSPACAIVLLKVTPEFETGFDKIAERISLFSEVESVTLVAGNADLEIIVSGKDIQEISMFVSRKLSTLPSVISTTTQFVLKRYKDNNIILSDYDEESDGRSLLL